MKSGGLMKMLSVSLLIPGLVWAHGNFDASKIKVPKNDKEVFITMGADALNSAYKEVGFHRMELKSQSDDVALIKIKESALPFINHIMHDSFNRCAGFIQHESLEEATAELGNLKNRTWGEKAIFADYSIDQQDTVSGLVSQVDSTQILATISKLSEFQNRYYKSKTGVQSSEWIAKRWKELTQGRSDASVELFDHPRWPQKSVILTIKGKSDEVVVVGGHADSIAGYWGREKARAPGADDNASGIATITEVIRVLMDNSYVPEKTLKFMGYAAEEVGLLGSKEVARDYKSQNVPVVGVMQLDMTNFNGSDLDIVMMTDYTNQEQNEFIGRLIDTYTTDVRWGYDKCGYACSDHASWTNQGFPASMPFEAKMHDMNGKIHTSRDTLDQSRGTASHASKFAKMALAFVVELDR